MPQLMTMTAPILVLIVWTFVLWFWMYATRIPAMRKARINPAKITTRDAFVAALPQKVNNIADNYNHLHEQPTIFYALAFYSHIIGVADMLNVWLAWAYVALRVAHSLIQCTSNFVPWRFYVFSASSLVLMAIAGRNLYALLAA